MTQDKKNQNINEASALDDHDYVTALRQNVLSYVAQKDITINNLAEESGLSVDTLKSFLYKHGKDCKLSTAILLAKALHVSIDELADAGTMRKQTMECLDIVRRLPKNDYDLLIWYIKRLGRVHTKTAPDIPKMISVLTPKCANGTLTWNDEWENESITSLSNDIRIKCFMGLRIPCVHYMPVYHNGDILLIAQDRQPANGEHCVLEIAGNFYVARCVRVGGDYKFHSIIDDGFRACFADINRVVGYVAHVIRAI